VIVRRLPFSVMASANPAALQACSHGRRNVTLAFPVVPGNKGPVAVLDFIPWSKVIAALLSGTCSIFFCFV